jgi:simple sugar transport system ATP-binding protein
MTAPAIACTGVTVSFGDFRALEDVGVAFAPGAIHAVVGQNGAGKTTFSRVLAGLIDPGSGEVQIAGTALHHGGVDAARRLGVELVHQHFTLPPSFTVAEALELFAAGRRGRAGFFRRARLERDWARRLEALQVSFDPHARIRDLPVEALQALEIARALASDARVLVLDEPTAVLSPPAAELLFARLRQLRDDGVTILVILHKLREVAAVADTVTVLRGGRVVLPCTPADTVTDEQLSALIVGSAATAVAPELDGAAVAADAAGTRVLSLRGVGTAGAEGDAALEDVSLDVAGGEIVGVAGVEGNGQRPLVGVIAGVVPAVAGTIELEGRPIVAATTLERRAAGVRVVPFDRNAEGVSATSAIWENVAILTAQEEPRWWISPRRLKARCRVDLERWQVSYRRLEEPVGTLSGGNVQRVILARELSAGIRLLLAAQPTRGLDVGATAFVRDSVRALASQGAGVLLVSSDLDELFELSDRLVVVLGGRVVGEFARPFDLAAVGAAMTGARAEVAA